MDYSQNFLKNINTPASMVRPRRWLFLILFILFLFFVFGGVLFSPVRHGMQAWEFANQGKEALTMAEQAGMALDFDTADDALTDATNYFTSAQTELEKLHWLTRVPWVGKQIRATDHLLSSGIETIGAAQEVLLFGAGLTDVFREIALARANLSPELSPEATLATLTPQEKRMILARFVADIPKLEAARAQIDEALASFANIPTSGLAGPLARAIQPVAEQLPRLRDDLDRAIPVAKLLPAFAGYPYAKQTLILFLNNAELRPGGGFIGTIGHLRIADATILSLETKDAYQVDRPAEAFLDIPSPAPLEQYLGVSQWFMRDANWSPDFARSAELTTHLYEREISHGVPIEQINNVIAFTPTFASDILRITGPVLVKEHLFNAENLFELLEYEVEQGFDDRGVPFHERKQILADLVDETITKLLSLPFARLEELLAVLTRGFDEKQIMVYDRNPDVQSQIEIQGWGGRVHEPSGDFFMVVDANLGSLKSDPEVERRIAYHIEPDNGQYLATVSVTYRHEGNFDWKTTRYRTYTRLYVSNGSEFVRAEGTLKDDKIKNPSRNPGVVDVGNDPDIPGTTYFGAFTSIEPGEEHTLSFTYRLSSQVVEQIQKGSYTLLAQKQLGAFAHQLTLDLDFGKTVRQADPSEDAEHFFDSYYEFRGDLKKDRMFHVEF